MMNNQNHVVFAPPVKGELHKKAIYEIIDGFKLFRSCNEETKESLIIAFAVIQGKHRLSTANKIKFAAHNPKAFSAFLVKQKKKYKKMTYTPTKVVLNMAAEGNE